MDEMKDEARILIKEHVIEDGQCQKLLVFFGPHHFLELEIVDGKTRFRVGCTHHGFEADASVVSSQLERIIEEVRKNHPDTIID